MTMLAAHSIKCSNALFKKRRHGNCVSIGAAIKRRKNKNPELGTGDVIIHCQIRHAVSSPTCSFSASAQFTTLRHGTYYFGSLLVLITRDQAAEVGRKCSYIYRLMHSSVWLIHNVIYDRIFGPL